MAGPTAHAGQGLNRVRTPRFLCFNYSMHGENEPPHLWYTRRSGVVRGPFPSPMIASFILLGRITDADELSTDKLHWQKLKQLPELIPEVMRNVVTEEDEQRLQLARMHADERLAEGRRKGSGPAVAQPGSAGGQDKRRGDRRSPESDRFRLHRSRRALLARPTEEPLRHPVLAPLLLGGIIVLLLGIFFFMRSPAPALSGAPDCAAPATPGVNWSYCHLEGAVVARAQLAGANMSNAFLVGANLQGAHLATSDLSYANLGAASLRAADLRAANMKGAVLHKTDLSGSDLSDANLSYANLMGANLTDAIYKNTDFSKATWVDGRQCAAASLGECK